MTELRRVQSKIKLHELADIAVDSPQNTYMGTNGRIWVKIGQDGIPQGDTSRTISFLGKLVYSSVDNYVLSLDPEVN